MEKLSFLIIPNPDHIISPCSAGIRFRLMYYSNELSNKHEFVICQNKEMLNSILSSNKHFDVIMYFKMTDPPISIIRDKYPNALVILDMCDNFLCFNDRTGDRFRSFIKDVDAVFTTNDFVADQCIKHGAKKAYATPELWESHYENNLEDFNKFKKPQAPYEILWHGNAGSAEINGIKSGGIQELFLIKDILKKNKDKIKLKIVTSFNKYNVPCEIAQEIKLLGLNSVEIKKWDINEINSDIKNTDICIVPSQGNDFTNGKSSNRLISSWMLKTLCIVSPVVPYVNVWNNNIEIFEQSNIEFIAYNSEMWDLLLNQYIDDLFNYRRKYLYNFAQFTYSKNKIINEWLSRINLLRGITHGE